MTELPHDKLPVVLIPGLQCDKRVWHFQIPYLEALGHDVIVPEGYFDTNTIPGMAEIVAAQLPERAYVAGWSMGGYILCALLARIPEKIAGAALIATSAQPESERRTLERRAAMMTARRQGMAVAYRTSFAVSSYRPENVPVSLQEQLVRMGEDIGIDAFFTQQAAIMARPDGRPALAGFKEPVLIVCGEEDVVTPPVYAREMHELVPRSELVMVPEAGHNAPIEQPGIVNEALRTWLTRKAVCPSAPAG